MDTRCFLAFSLTFLLISPHLSRASIRISGQKKPTKKGVFSVVFDPTRVIPLSWSPRVFTYKGFLSHEECDHLIDLGKDKLVRSVVGDNSTESEIRTSSGMFLVKHQDEVVADIEARIAAWTFLPEENAESIQILRYQHGQKYEPHFDFFYDKVYHEELGGHRVATVLMYLSDVESGGETFFPSSQAGITQGRHGSWSECAKRGYAVKPRKGDALLFFNLHLNGTTDVYSLHGSCPVIKGEKWSATKWIHARTFHKPKRHSAKGECVDKSESCPMWAKAGECEKNPEYMLGSEKYNGYCRKSCKVCSS
ncbi:hypothetical protein SLEP1_g10230 [Rubroshorea leprosula]|uniref:procollagen-proline 4-dioxygenase n=1 Tax=Rubroshorea leprosula TaxID=152421 RepID=A0AAV5IGP7_9ROSI|nr:hypothetical protein SLEP1_g10230 [Rubroshorea leprosula]